MRRYHKTFVLVDTEEEAKMWCEGLDKRATRYMRQKHPAYYTPWESQDHTEHKFVVWHYV